MLLEEEIYLDCMYQQTVGIPMGTNCAPLSADLLLYLYEADFIQGFLKNSKKKLARSFNFTFRYIDDVFSLNKNKISPFLAQCICIYVAHCFFYETQLDQLP
jgi:hypothetical protein